MSALRLTAPRRRRLERQLRATHDAGLFRRTLAILEAADGRPIAEFARLLRISRVSVYDWIACYERGRDPARLADSRGGNRPSARSEELQAVLAAGMGQRPDHPGYRAVEWAVPLLQEHLAHWGGERLSATSIRRRLHELGYVWKRPRYVLDPDPERDKITANPPGDPASATPLGRALRG